jgi:hypothetical protein
MADAPAPLILDFLEWIGVGPRPYGEVMESWRTSCPRLTVWEDAVDAGLVVRCGRFIELAPFGRRLLEESGRLAATIP